MKRGQTDARSIFIGGLGLAATSGALESFLRSRTAGVKVVTALYHREGAFMGAAKASFTSKEAAAHAITLLYDQPWSGRRLRARTWTGRAGDCS